MVVSRADAAQAAVCVLQFGYQISGAGLANSYSITASRVIEFYPLDPPSSMPPEQHLLAGGTYSLRVTQEEVLGWGNPATLPAFPPGDFWFLPVPSPIDWVLPSELVSVTGGDNFGFALLTDGSITGWGVNYDGQLEGAGLQHVAQVEAGHDHALALRADGTVWSAGSSRFGQLCRPFGSN